jgi:hypothetical protein
MNADILYHSADGAIRTRTVRPQVPSQREKQTQQLPENYVHCRAVIVRNRDWDSGRETVFGARVFGRDFVPCHYHTAPHQLFFSDLLEQIPLVLPNPSIA